MESPRWSVTELVARASDRCDRAALDLALALVVVFASSAGRSLGSLWLAFADRPPRRGDLHDLEISRYEGLLGL
jgi:hypothetical protein